MLSKNCCALLVLFFTWQLVLGKDIYLFDLGKSDSPLEENYTRVTPENLYTSGQGFGFLDETVYAFDTVINALSNALTRDGVYHPDEISFRLDLAPGDYFLTLIVGNSTYDTLKMEIQHIADTSIEVPFFRLPYRSMCQVVTIQADHLVINVSAKKGIANLHAIEVRRSTSHHKIPGLSQQSLEQDTAIIAAYAHTLQQQLQSDPENAGLRNQLARIQLYLQANYYYDVGWWSWAVEETGLSIFDRFHAAIDWLEQILADPSDPLYTRSLYLLGKIHYWLDKEQDIPSSRRIARQYFDQLHAIFPNHPTLNMYRGEQVPYALPQEVDTSGAPRWAILQKEAIERMTHIIHWWVDSMQAENGELGGKYGDDVEILRWWLPAVLGADDDKARLGYKRLADGVWNSGKLEQGYSRKLEDVEHAAELIRDSHPLMLILAYGDPVYVERCMVGMQHLDSLWTGITPLGHRHFKSAYFSATEMWQQEPYGVDVPMNARATLTGLWAAWYNRNPKLIRLFTEWGKAWVYAAQQTTKDKPKGIIPAAVRFDNNEIGGYSNNWYHPNLGWTYYNWEHMSGIHELFYQMLGMYHITQNDSLLIPYHNVLERVATYQPQLSRGKLDIGSESWVNQYLAQDTKLISLGLNLELPQYEALIAERGNAYAQYLLKKDPTLIENGLEEALSTLRYNLPLYTSEVKFTDRVYVQGDELLTGMYTGHIGSGFEFPFLQVSWENTGTQVAVLVEQASDSALDISIHNFDTQRKIGMRTWRLPQGKYALSLRSKDSGAIVQTDTIHIAERGQLTPIELSQQGTYYLSVSRLSIASEALFPRPDVALSNLKLLPLAGQKDSVAIELTVHNIGNLPTGEITLQVNTTLDSPTLFTYQLPSIPPPNELIPQRRIVKLSPISIEQAEGLISISAMLNQPEITLLNNQITYQQAYSGGE